MKTRARAAGGVVVLDGIDYDLSDILDKDQIRRGIPKVGDKLRLRPTVHKDAGRIHDCVVTYVDLERMWFQVEFEIDGYKFKECYKLPMVEGDKWIDERVR